MNKVRLFKFLVFQLLLTFSFSVTSQSPDNILSAADANYIANVSKRSIANGGVKDEDITQLTQRSIFQVNKSNSYLRVDFSVDNLNATLHINRRPQQVYEASIQVGKSTYNIRINEFEDDINVSGFGSRLSTDEKVLLYALMNQLDTERWQNSKNRLKKELHWMVNWLSEMPAGTVLNEFNPKVSNINPIATFYIDNNFPTEVEQEESYEENSAYVEDCEIPYSSGSTAGPCEPPPPCINVDDDDGVTNIACSYSLNRPTSHDACSAHGFRNYTINTGCNLSSDCIGRCGGKCGKDYGAGRYTQDCADHDYCCANHGGCADPLLGVCADEWRDAIDDFRYGIECSDCKPSPPPCGSPLPSTQTLVLGTKNDDLIISELDFDLFRSSNRNDKPIYLEEWAILEIESGEPIIINGSSNKFSNHLLRNRENIRHLNTGNTTVLVVEAAEGAHSTGHISTHSIAPFTIKSRTISSRTNTNFWIRAEITTDGIAEKVDILDISSLNNDSALKKLLSEELSSQFHSEIEHRLVVFLRVSITDTDTTLVSDAVVITPQCCGGCGAPPGGHCP